MGLPIMPVHNYFTNAIVRAASLRGQYDIMTDEPPYAIYALRISRSRLATSDFAFYHMTFSGPDSGILQARPGGY